MGPSIVPFPTQASYASWNSIKHVRRNSFAMLAAMRRAEAEPWARALLERDLVLAFGEKRCKDK